MKIQNPARGILGWWSGLSKLISLPLFVIPTEVEESLANNLIHNGWLVLSKGCLGYARHDAVGFALHLV